MNEPCNFITTKTGVQVYENDIMQLADEYISTLSDEDNIKGMNKGLFTGLIKHIYTSVFKDNKLDYDDIDNLDNIFNIYVTLCYRLNKRPTMLGFSLMIGVSKDTINNWLNNNTRGYIYYDENDNRIYNINTYKMLNPDKKYRQEASSLYSNSVKKWLSECENTLLDGAIENNSIGCIFALKANYNYRDNVVVNVQENAIGTPERSREEIAQNYGIPIEQLENRPQPDMDF